MSEEQLEALPEDWQTALAIVAHPDDMEFGAAAAVAHWTGQGKKVVYCMVTSGEAGIDGMHPDLAGPAREAEQIAACHEVGVEICDFLRLPDGILEYGVPLRRTLAEVVRRHRPEIVITNNFHPTFGGRNLNQADHIATGKATLDAVRDAGNRWVFPEQLTDGVEPWGGVKAVWVAGSPEAQHAVDISRQLRRRSQVARRPRGLHRRTRLGGVGPRGVPRRFRPPDRSAVRYIAGDGLRGVPDGLGRVMPNLSRRAV